jgi:hypothetical protein
MKAKELFTYLMILTVFSGGFVIGSMSFEFYLCYLVFLSFIFFALISRYSLWMNRGFLLLFLYFSLSSLISIIIFKYSPMLLVKQVVGISFSAFSYYLLIKVNNYDVEKLFKLYLRVALIIAMLGIFQEISYLLNFVPGYDWQFFIPKAGEVNTTLFLMRISSLSPEPAMLAVLISPAMFIALNNFFLKKGIYFDRFNSAVILLAYALTFSSLAYIGLGLAFILIMYRQGRLNIRSRKIFYLPLVLLLLFLMFYSCYQFIPDFRSRTDAVFALFYNSSAKIYDLNSPMLRNASVFILFSNYEVAFDSLRTSPLIGYGLGSHAAHFDQYFQSFLDSAKRMGSYELLHGWGFGVSKDDANSLILRLVSETGVIGMMIIFWLIGKFFIKRETRAAALFDPGNLSLINNAILLLILLRLIRFGHYFVDGLFFFAFLYYFSSKEYGRLGLVENDKVVAR